MERTAVALGTFDGVHNGHMAVINNAVKSGFKPIAVAFPEPPKGILLNKKEVLTSPEEKKALLKSVGISEVYYLDFNKVKNISPEEFLLYLKNKFNPAVISCGFNYRFGKNGEGTTLSAEEFCLKNSIMLKQASRVCINGRPVSSTYIRQLLLNGDIIGANKLLLKPFGFSAEIIHGDKRGRTIGFPTINQVYPENAAKLKYGVYKTAVTVCGKRYSGVTNVGVRPTFKNGIISAETYINGFSGDIYGITADVRFLSYIREERKFSSVDELKANIINDIEKAR